MNAVSSRLRRAAPLSAVLLCLSLATAASAADIELTVTGVSGNSGNLIVALLTPDNDFPRDENPYASKMKKVHRGEPTFRFTNIAPGIYAIAVYHDENGNGKLDSNLLGMPTEAYGFSNNARGSFGPPDFRDAVFTVGADPVRLSVKVEK